MSPAPQSPPFADLHQDLLSHAEAWRSMGAGEQTSYELIERSGAGLVVLSTFNMHPGGGEVSTANAAYSLRLMDRYRGELAGRGWTQVLESADLEREGIRAIVHVEGIGALEAPVEEVLGDWWRRGCRSVGPMWNERNGIGGGPTAPEEPLSELGLRAVRWIDRAPMLLDLAHMGERTFRDTLAATDGVVLVSHANARALCEHPRNLHDDQIRAIAERDGLVGVVLSKAFLGLGEDLAAVVRHAEHIAALAGVEHLAIGTDLGGVTDPLGEVPAADALPLLLEALEQAFGPRDCRAIAWDNAIRVIRTSLERPPP